MLNAIQKLEKKQKEIELLPQGRERFAAIDIYDATELLKDIEDAIKSAVMGRYERLWVFTNNYPHVIAMVQDRINYRELVRCGIRQLKVLNVSKEDEINYRRSALSSPIPTLIFSQVNDRHNSTFW